MKWKLISIGLLAAPVLLGMSAAQPPSPTITPPVLTPAPSATPLPGQSCEPMQPGDGEDAEDVAAGVRLGWSGAFRCNNAPAQGNYAFSLTISSAVTSTAAAIIEAVELTHTTPRPQGIAPQATVTATGVPVTVTPGASATVIVSGTYSLVSAGAAQLANLHFCVKGKSANGERFYLGVNALFRGANMLDPESQSNAPPVISNIVVLPTWQGAIVRWATDIPAHGRVDYGPGTTPDRSRSAGCGGANAHEVVITGLDAGRMYAYRIFARDDFGNAATTEVRSLTPAAIGVFAPLTLR